MQRRSVVSPASIASAAAPSTGSRSRGEGALPTFDRRAVCALLALQLGLRIVLATRQRFNSDEAQHFHVAWAWVHGLLPYRDVFDNHAPLFHLLASPLVAALGEHPDVLVWARWAMIPLAAIALGSLYQIGATLYSRRVGAWAAALAGLIPFFFTTSLEFRADDLWVALWLAALATAASGMSARLRPLFVGALVGAAFAVSIKTALLLSTLVAGIAVAHVIDPHRSERRATAAFALWLGGCFVGMLAVLAPMTWLLVHLGLFGEFIECVVLHNSHAFALADHRVLRIVLVAVTLPALLLGARRVFDRPDGAFPRAGLLLATGFYALLLNGFSPIVSPQDWLPLYALLAMFAVAGAVALEKRASGARVASWLVGVAALEIAATVYVVRPWRDGTLAQRALVAEVLRLTRPADFVMDVKGEMLFRRRAYYPVLEDVTLARIRNGDVPDDIADRLVATRTYVAVNDNERFPPGGRRFLLGNYLPVGALRVAGKLLVVNAAGRSEFTLSLPGRYVVLSPTNAPLGTLDGRPMIGARQLDAGSHTVEGAVPGLPLALLWADAADRGLSPFHPRQGT
jgi:hypothetical protein